MDSKLAKDTTKASKPRATGSNFSTQRLLFGVALSAGLVFFSYQSQSSYLVCSPSGNIYTVDETNPRAECISVRDARITSVGSYRSSLLHPIYASCFLNLL